MRNLSLLLACCAAAGCSSEPLDPGPVDEKDPVLHYDREIHIPDLDGTVSAFYDDVGMLSLDCETDRDCLAAQGYFHAHDRFFQMDLRRRFALGTLSEVVGGITLETDHQQRIKLSTREGKPIAQQFLESLSPEMLAAFEAYSRGVNAWLEDLRQGKNGAMMSKEYAFLNIDVSLLSDWSPIDCIASFLPIVDRLTNDSPKDLLSGQAIAELGMPIGSDLYGVRVVSTSTVLPAPAAKAAVNPPQIRALLPWHAAITGARQVVGDAEAIVGQGSNNWAVAPSHAG
ncbi:MAG: penicillin acylase family protein, partial [Myxococcales bacterium]|nr:penicillin acylase family protein [Myxococcales bacterium]